MKVSLCLSHFPRNNLSRLQQIEQVFVAWIYHKAMESIEPDFNSSLNGGILPDTRNGNFGRIIRSDICKFGVLGQENNILSDQTFQNFGIFYAALSEDNDVFRIISRRPEPMIERQRKVLIQENLQECCSTAGGTCSATCAA